MISSLGAMLRMSIRRSRADWPIVVAAGLICLIASTLVAAGVIYGDAVARASLHRALADAPVAGTNISVTVHIPPVDGEPLDPRVTAELDAVFGPTGGAIQRQVRSGSFALPDQPADAVHDLAVLGYADALPDHASLVAGTWPTEPTAAGPIPVAISEDVAASLGLELGRRLRLESRTAAGFIAEIQVAGIFRIADPAAPYWFAEGQVLDGVQVGTNYTTYGPFFTTRRAIMTRAAPGSVEFGWHAFPDTAALAVADIGGLRARVDALPARLDAAIGDIAVVQTDLPGILARIEPSLLVSRTGVLVLTIQLVALAVFAVLLSASLLTEHRRLDTAVLRSRGAGPYRVLGLAAIEGLGLTVSAALVAPWLAAAMLGTFNIAGPLAEIGLQIAPEVSSDAYLAAAAAAAICLIALTLPVVRAGRSLAAVHGTLARGETRGVGQRFGLDIALVVVAAIGLWQLRHYGVPLTRTVHGTLGLDPLLVATPTIGLLAGAILALRIVPRIARVIERFATRGRGLVPAMGARQLSRRPLRYTRAAALLILAMAMGVFAVSYAWTWSASQADQAAFQTGADLRVVPGHGAGSTPEWAQDRRLAALPGVIARTPVKREPMRLPGTSRTGRLVAIDAAAAPSVVDIRSDLTSISLPDLMAPLAAKRPTVVAVPLPGSPRTMRLAVDVEIRALERLERDEVTNADTYKDAALSAIEGWPGLGASVVVRDALGILHRFPGGTSTLDAGSHVLDVTLAPPDTQDSFAYPLELFAVDLSLTLPQGYRATDATVTVRDVAAAGDDGAWQPVALGLDAGWRSTASFFGRPPNTIAGRDHGPGSDGIRRGSLAWAPGREPTGSVVRSSWTGPRPPSATSPVSGCRSSRPTPSWKRPEARSVTRSR